VEQFSISTRRIFTAAAFALPFVRALPFRVRFVHRRESAGGVSRYRSIPIPFRLFSRYYTY